MGAWHGGGMEGGAEAGAAGVAGASAEGGGSALRPAPARRRAPWGRVLPALVPPGGGVGGGEGRAPLEARGLAALRVVRGAESEALGAAMARIRAAEETSDVREREAQEAVQRADRRIRRAREREQDLLDIINALQGERDLVSKEMRVCRQMAQDNFKAAERREAALREGLQRSERTRREVMEREASLLDCIGRVQAERDGAVDEMMQYAHPPSPYPLPPHASWHEPLKWGRGVCPAAADMGQRRMIEQTIRDVDLLKDKVKRANSLDPPPAFLCPITRAVMHSPVVTSDGHTYEREAIKRWLAQSTTSPCTGLVLRSNRLVPNFALKGAIDNFARGQGTRAHPAGEDSNSGVSGGAENATH